MLGSCQDTPAFLIESKKMDSSSYAWIKANGEICVG